MTASSMHVIPFVAIPTFNESAGIVEAQSNAIVLFDGTGQHPPEVNLGFIEAWCVGAQVLVGVWRGSPGTNWFKHQNLAWLYCIFNRLSLKRLIQVAVNYKASASVKAIKSHA